MVYRAERTLVIVSLVVMAIVVFLDVVHRSFSGDDSKIAMIASKVAKWFGSEIGPESSTYQSIADASPIILFVVFTWLAYFGIRSAKRETMVKPPVALVAAVIGVIVTYGLIQLMLTLMPNGLIWSQPLAMMLTLWVGFVGASMCTYENRHLRVEALQRAIPEKLRPAIGFLSFALTAAICFMLCWLSIRDVRFNYNEFIDTDGKGGLFLGMPVPKYLGFSALPVAFGFMGVRFSAKAVGAAKGEIEEPMDPVAAAGGLPDEEGGKPPSEVATQAIPVADERPSDIDTVTSRSAMEEQARGASPPRPSDTPTDAHDVGEIAGMIRSNPAASSGAAGSIGDDPPDGDATRDVDVDGLDLGSNETRDLSEDDEEGPQ